jgi:predicted RNA-binding protein associated with RNAse of E/G family
MTEITIVKRDYQGKPVLEYSGELVERDETWVCVRARFNFNDKPVGNVVFRRGDTFIEWHFADRWYNIFELHDVSDGHLKGWYCNVTRPAVIRENKVEADDLALDILISPAGDLLVLDEDEFIALDIPDHERLLAMMVVDEIRNMVKRQDAPFDRVLTQR